MRNAPVSDENHNSMEGQVNRGYDDDEARDEPGPLHIPGPGVADGSKRRKKSSFLSVDHTELNSHTYVYDANKSFEGMTVSQGPHLSPTIEIRTQSNLAVHSIFSNSFWEIFWL